MDDLAVDDSPADVAKQQERQICNSVQGGKVGVLRHTFANATSVYVPTAWAYIRFCAARILLDLRGPLSVAGSALRFFGSRPAGKPVRKVNFMVDGRLLICITNIESLSVHS